MKLYLQLVALLFGANLSAQLLYNINLEGAQHVVGQVPAVRNSIENPSRIVFGSPTVVSGAFGFSTKLLKFTGYVRYEQIELDINQSNQRFVVSFDLMTENLKNSQYTFTVLFDAPEVHNFYLHGGTNQFHIYQPFNSNGNLGAFVDGNVYHIELGFDTISDRMTVDIDGQRVFSASHGRATTLSSIRFSMAPWIGGAVTDTNVKAYMDNLVVTSSPVGIDSPITSGTVTPPVVAPPVTPPAEVPPPVVPPAVVPAPITYGIIVSSASIRQGTTSASRLYPAGKSCSVIAFPKTGYRFRGWKEKGRFVSNLRVYRFTADRSRHLVAVFDKR